MFFVYKSSFGCTKRDSKCKFNYKGTYYWPRLRCLPLPLPLPPPLPHPVATVPGPGPMFSLVLVLVLVLPALLLVPLAWLPASGVVWLGTVASSIWGWAKGGAFVSCPTSISRSISSGACISFADISVK